MDGLIYKIATQSDADPSVFILSDETVDRYGDVISASGWDLANFAKNKNPIALFNHHSDAVIGKWENVRVEGSRLIGKLVLAAFGTSDLVNTVRKLWEQGMLRAVSVGFKSTEKEPLTKDADPFWGPFRYLKQELVECSLVAVPANPNALQVSRSFENALQVSRSFALPAEISRSLSGKLARGREPETRAVPGKLATPQIARSLKWSAKSILGDLP